MNLSKDNTGALKALRDKMCVAMPKLSRLSGSSPRSNILILIDANGSEYGT
jgi:hypothetical protein